MYIVLFIPFN